MIKADLKTFDTKATPAAPAAKIAAPAAIGTSMEEIQKKIDEMLAKAEQAAGKIVEAANQQAGDIMEKALAEVTTSAPKQINPSEEAKEKAEFEKYMNELVPVYLFKDNNKYRDDVPVIVNGETILIQRGKHVQIKRKFAQVLDNSQMQDAFAADHMTELSEQYKQKESMLSR